MNIIADVDMYERIKHCVTLFKKCINKSFLSASTLNSSLVKYFIIYIYIYIYLIYIEYVKYQTIPKSSYDDALFQWRIKKSLLLPPSHNGM